MLRFRLPRLFRRRRRLDAVERTLAAYGGITLVTASIGAVAFGAAAIGALALARQLKRQSDERALNPPPPPEPPLQPLDGEPAFSKPRRRAR